MKPSSFRTIVFLLVVLALCGCDCDETTTSDIRQSIVESYHTTEVVAVDNLQNYIVRDTNGAIWYVDFRDGKPHPTKVFDSNK